MREIATQQELLALTGQLVAVSDWITVEQSRVDLFAEATGDKQWIHVDVARSRAESPYGSTIAHGFLSLSLIPMMLETSLQITPAKMGVNYGLNKVRFPSAVKVGCRVRGHITLAQLDTIEGGVQIVWHVLVEIEGVEKPGCVAELITRLYW